MITLQLIALYEEWKEQAEKFHAYAAHPTTDPNYRVELGTKGHMLWHCAGKIRELVKAEELEPNMDAIKTREINVLVRENRALLANRDELVAVLHEARNVVRTFIEAETIGKIDDSLWLEFQRKASDVLYKVTGKP